MRPDMKDKIASQTGNMARAPLQSEGNRPRRILVVDEDNDLRLMYALVLARSGYHVDIAEDGGVTPRLIPSWRAEFFSAYLLRHEKH